MSLVLYMYLPLTLSQHKENLKFREVRVHINYDAKTNG